MERHWIDWTDDFLPQAAAWLVDRARDGSRAGATLVDMSNTVCVTPGRRAGRVLLAFLARRCEGDGTALLPPLMITPGELGDELLVSGAALATAPERVLAWIKALRETDPGRLETLLPTRPDAEDLRVWHELASAIHELHEELSGEDIAFREVPERAERLELFAEGDRWGDLSRLATRYEAALDQAGLVDPHHARRAALAAGEVEAETAIVLLGVTELTAGQRAIVDAAGDRVVALVHAPPELADRFDDHGCVETTAWSGDGIDLRDDQIVVADDPADQARAAMASLAHLDDAFAADEITIGICDRTLMEPIERAAAWAGVDVHAAPGTPLTATAPYRLLAAIADFIDDPRHATFAALVRFPAVEARVRERAKLDDVIAILDRHYAEHLVERPDRTADGGAGAEELTASLRAVWRIVDEMLASLKGDARPLAGWSEAILGVLVDLYGAIDPASMSKDERTTVEACLKLRDALAARSKLPETLQPRLDAATAIAFLLAEAKGEELPADVHARQVEMLEWLELHLDPAPVLTLVGVNDGRLPTTSIGGLFLPDVLRRALGITHNEQRYARDAYRFEAIRRSRKRLCVISGRVAADGEPLAPSRLLLAGDDETVLERVRRLFGAPPPEERPLPIGAPPCATESRFIIPELKPVPDAPAAMAVTEFRTYLQCPYRYALARRLRLEALGDDVREMDALQFGTLAHDVLEEFGKDPDARIDGDRDRIEAYLLDVLRRRAADRFGRRPIPAVRIQVARLAERLGAFAAMQARTRAAGWAIRHAELSFDGEVALDVPGQKPMPLKGKIDRIDYNERSGRWRVIDYKSSEKGASPIQSHHDRKSLPDDPADVTWHDLQLPLYHYLLRQRGSIPADDGGETVDLCYFVLPKKADDTAILPAGWRRAHLDAAVDVARDVVRDIRAGNFELNQEHHSPYDDFARICQTYAYHEVDPGGDAEGDAS